MQGFRIALLTLLCASLSTVAAAASDEERIKRLEAMVEKQQQMIEALSKELQELKSGPIIPVERLDETPEDTTTAYTTPDPDDGPAANPLAPLTLKLYGFAMADAIYDFKRVDPNWEDTLRVSTIPTRSGAFGDDGNFTFGVRQSRLGVSGGYGDDIRYLLEWELFGVGGDEGQTTPRLRHLQEPRGGPVLVQLYGHRHLPQYYRLLGPDRDGVLPQPAAALQL